MEARTITFFSPKGGVGKTLFSLNLAVSLMAKGKKVLLVDLDLGAPQMTAKLLGVEAKYSLFSLIGHLDEFKEKKRNLQNYVTSYKKDLFFLPSINKLAQRAKLTSEVIKDFISIAKKDFDYIVIDAGNNLSDVLIAAFDSSSLILLVLTPDILSVYQTEWILDTLQSIGFPL
ncbi:MAG: AAA family ATPase, partial [Candidatus Omnitrophica bacterium]|nr:AAA family ATPase [Candidatus Omnitrophota bacterium]